MRDDFFTNTEADAGRYEALRAADEFDDQEFWDGPDVVEAGGIRCAHCKQRHATVDDVRWCSAVEAQLRAEHEAEAEADVAYARHREAIAENGTWFGPQTEADTWD